MVCKDDRFFAQLRERQRNVFLVCVDVDDIKIVVICCGVGLGDDLCLNLTSEADKSK